MSFKVGIQFRSDFHFCTLDRLDCEDFPSCLGSQLTFTEMVVTLTTLMQKC
jgi:hypothetical protein